ncbi:YchJ family protein [Ferrovibrio sp.]|uniref:YchJ family protein n=1 Tax=Ferrovibrio sp. TaxID=1917215 RepID=UPI0026203489|nr:YchJ family protein [Ferrovibrio sp.]
MPACPCQSGLSFEDCCGPILAGRPAPTALALMRSRYTAYARGDVAYLARTLAPEHRAGFDAADVSAGMRETQWLGLEILDTKDGGAADSTGIVEFAACFRAQGRLQVLQERSRFRREADQNWVYVDGETALRPAKKPSRNDPCLCGSGRKFKQCCGRA